MGGVEAGRAIGRRSHCFQQVAEFVAGHRIADDSTISLGQHSPVRSKNAESLGHRRISEPSGHRQVGHADGASVVNTQEQGQSARVAQYPEPGGPMLNVLGLAYSADGLTNQLIVEHVPSAAILRNEMHPSSVPQTPTSIPSETLMFDTPVASVYVDGASTNAEVMQN
jgi:hypothetical protein